MISMYKSIWSDAINYERIKNGGETHWKAFTFTYMTAFMSLNLITFLSLIQSITKFDIGILLMNKILLLVDNEAFSNLIWFFTIAVIPSSLINYIFVFYNQRYKNILEDYKFKQGKLLLIYFILTVISFFGISLIKKYLA